jgi:hypothetical protein
MDSFDKPAINMPIAILKTLGVMTAGSLKTAMPE